ncbi:MAG TPA: hemolysin III family protein [Sphaerochaeta sp.]|nr:hemolysin III family protein [Sphaerochaeta sp.]
MTATVAAWLDRHITLHTHDDPQAELMNSLTHAFGAILAAIALVVVLFSLPAIPTLALRTGFIVWALSMLLLYSVSAAYHAIPHGTTKRLFRLFDHSSIYILIAGTYTPLLLYIATTKAIGILALVWAIAAVGILLTVLFWQRFKILHVACYVVMGWLILFFAKDIFPLLPAGLLGWVIAAGVTYTSGLIFYGNKRIPHYHAIWHLFCIGGSALFFIGYFRTLI